jgi:alpha-L-fucosidase 2
MKMKSILLRAIVAALPAMLPATGVSAAETQPSLQLWYDTPATNWSAEALPIGNGRLGAMFFGGVERERIQFNEDSLWTGDDCPSGDYNKMGAYQAFGDVVIEMPSYEMSNYRRELNIAEAVGRVTYRSGGINYSREYFASRPGDVIVIRLTADKPGGYTGVIALTDMHDAQVTASKNRLTSSGALDNGLKYETQLLVINDGGSVETAGTKLEFKGCNSLTLLLAAGTDYAMDYARHYRGAPPHARLTQQLSAASKKPFKDLRAAHVKDFQSLFNRCRLDLGTTPAARRSLPTNERLAAYAKEGGNDPELESLLFQYGRYLLISCSRPGGLPANLQGLWNDSNNPPWHSDYHANINIQMNYWLAEPANLAECHEPLFDLIRSQLEPWRRATTAAQEFALPSGKTRGWAVRTSHNITGGMAWKWDNTANAWYCQHLWEHYAFSGDKNYLRKVAYPLLKETCEFWEDHLKTLPDGRLVVPMCWSPEHGPTEDGVSYSQEILWDLFSNYIEAANTLGIDRDYREQIASMRDKLVTPKIGSWGQLQEWMTDIDNPKDPHRHTSHLFAVYPGRQISVAKTPDLAKAAAVSLAARGEAGDSRRSWTWPWRCALWARLGRPEDAHRMVRGLLTYNMLPNLFAVHPPFQMDGNFGITAGICETLLQSHANEISLLPALPQAWPAGSVKGLRARGGFTVDIEWKDGRLTKATITSLRGGRANVRLADRVVSLDTRRNQTIWLGRDLSVPSR